VRKTYCVPVRESQAGTLALRLLLIGAPGAGKGTQAERLAERFGIAHVSSGDLLRQHVQDQTSIGRMIKSCLDHGEPAARIVSTLVWAEPTPQSRQRSPRWHAFGSGRARIRGPSCEVERIRR
jgi:Adenylate kinase